MRLILDRFPVSGLRVPVYCEQNGISVWQFRYWRRRLGFRFRKRKGSLKGAAYPQRADFVRLGSLPGGSQAVPVLDSTLGDRPAWGFEVRFSNGIVFRGTEELALKGLDRIRRFGR
jgi:hypothetical protein